MTPHAAVEHPSRPLALASEFSYDVLAELYNNTRVDYIVPMPMNAAKMREYVTLYDVALDHSFVALDGHGQPVGLGMMGVRGQRAWITRLGILPSQRGRGLGQSLMDAMLGAAGSSGCHTLQLEAIHGNDPARRLFEVNGFTHVRDVLVVRRPPRTGQTSPLFDPSIQLQDLSAIQIERCLAARTDTPTWLDETPSVLKRGNLRGLSAIDPHGRASWLVYHAGLLQLSHFVFGPYIDEGVARALLFAAHNAHPKSDTKIENVPADSPYWPVMMSMGYLSTFTRQEMVLTR